MSDQAALATMIRTRLLGVRPDDQDLALEDHDWRLIIEALEALGPGPMTSKQVRDFAMKHDHFAVPVRPGVTVTWTDEESGEVVQRATLKGKNVIRLAASRE